MTMTEDEIHEHIDFKAVEEIARRVADQFGAQTGQTQPLAEYLDRTIHNEVLGHLGVHRVSEIAPRYVPEMLLPLMFIGLVRIWVEAFVVGANFQAQKDAELIKLDVPDFIPEG